MKASLDQYIVNNSLNLPVATERIATEQKKVELSSLVDRVVQLARSIETDTAGLTKPINSDRGHAEALKAVVRNRRARENMLPRIEFADPSWDMLLDLTICRLEGRTVSVSSLCIAAAVPTTTALRHIKAMTDTGVLKRVADPSDGRRNYVVLSDDVFEQMMALARKAWP